MGAHLGRMAVKAFLARGHVNLSRLFQNMRIGRKTEEKYRNRCNDFHIFRFQSLIELPNPNNLDLTDIICLFFKGTKLWYGSRSRYSRDIARQPHLHNIIHGLLKCASVPSRTSDFFSRILCCVPGATYLELWPFLNVWPISVNVHGWLADKCWRRFGG